jgi:RTA1 like protein
VAPNHITITFVISDITTFLIQVCAPSPMKNVLYHISPGNWRGCLSASKHIAGRKTWFSRECIILSGHRDSLTRVQIFLGALIIQLISFIIFTCIFLRFVHRVRRFERDVWTLHHGCQWYNDWRALTVALGISCVGIIVRPLLYSNLVVRAYG